MCVWWGIECLICIIYRCYTGGVVSGVFAVVVIIEVYRVIDIVVMAPVFSLIPRLSTLVYIIMMFGNCLNSIKMQ